MKLEKFSNTIFLILLIYFLNFTSSSKIKKQTLKVEDSKTTTTPNTSISLNNTSSTNSNMTNSSLTRTNSESKTFLETIFEPQHIFSEDLASCSNQTCSSPYGNCTSKTVCTCNFDYASQPNKNTTGTEMACTYKLKHQGWFFLLEFFTWVGVGHFYVGRLVHGLVKLFTVFFVIAMDCIVRKFCSFHEYKYQTNYNVFIYILYFAILFGQMYDIVMIGLNKYSDGQGMIIRTWDK